MGRPSRLTEKQWQSIGKRLVAGETTSALAREFKVSKSTISERFSERTNRVKATASLIVKAETALNSLTVSEQVSAQSLADQLRSISSHLAGAANFGAATAHRLSGIANAQVQKIDDAEPLGLASLESLKGVAILTKLANDSGQIGLNLLAANKEMIKEAASGGNQTPGELMRELVQYLPD